MNFALRGLWNIWQVSCSNGFLENRVMNSETGLMEKLQFLQCMLQRGVSFVMSSLFDGDWPSKATPSLRRLYYVGMTRAKETLTLFEFTSAPNPFSSIIRNQPFVLSDNDAFPARNPALNVRFIEQGNADVYMDFAGQSADPKLHQSISELRVGDEIKLVGREFQNKQGCVVGRLSKNCVLDDQKVITVKVSAIASRYEKQVTDPVWR